MTNELQLFSGDVILAGKVAEIMLREGCKDFIETGTLDGGTSLGMHKLFPDVTVWTVEAHEERFNNNRRDRFAGTGIKDFFGGSPTVLREQIIPNLKDRHPLFYLDAHSPVSFPILGELDAIAACAHLEPIIVIHDFYNPFRPDMACEVDPAGHKQDLDYIYDRLGSIYPDGPVAFYNWYATKHQIGVVFIGIGQW
jgi:hypothetical protein